MAATQPARPRGLLFPWLPISSGPSTVPLCRSCLFPMLRVCATPSFTDGPWAAWGGSLPATALGQRELCLEPQPAGEPCGHGHGLLPRSPTPRLDGPPRNHGDSSGPPRGLGRTLLPRTEAKHDRLTGGDHVVRVRSARQPPAAAETPHLTLTEMCREKPGSGTAPWKPRAFSLAPSQDHPLEQSKSQSRRCS